MVKNKRYLVVDAGNTRIKVAVFNKEQLAEIHHFKSDELQQLKTFLIDNRFHDAIISSVRSEKETKWMLQLMQGAKLFKNLPKYPIQLNYETPETLGADRLANAIAAHSKAKGSVLVVDIGTCIKFDLVSKDGIYQGGSISPGIEMRYKALNHFTAGLPLVNNFERPKLIGKSTVDCMHTGVMLGVEAEIKAFIKDYQSQYEGLTIFITGGDAQYFDFDSKNNIFVDENLTLTGLFITIQAHVH